MIFKFLTVLIIPLVATVIFLFFNADADLNLVFSSVDDSVFEDKVVVITGASSGIGEYYAYEMCNRNAKVVLVARREEKLLKVKSNCKSKHDPLVYVLDLNQLDQHDKLIEKVTSTFGTIDHLVLNAGISQRSLVEDTEFNETQKIMDLNFFATIHLATKVLPLFTSQQSGEIIVVSSLAGKIGNPIGSSYSASKFALHGFFDGLRAEVSGDGIGVRMICPGPVQSEISIKSYKGSYGTSDEGDSVEDEEKKMLTDRCTHLMAVAVSRGVDEAWISPQPYLLFTYLNQYTPKLWRNFMKVVGPARVEAYKEGSNVYDIKKVFGKVFGS